MEDAFRYRRLVRLANRLQVLADLLKATSDSLHDILVDAGCCPPPSVPASATAVPAPGSAGATPAADTRRPQDPLARSTVTRGTLLGMLDRLDDALERDEKFAAQTAANELRHLVDDLPL